jgi:predicted nucleic acid-binding protein
MIHFDTNFLVAALQPDTPEQAKLDAWTDSKETLGVSAIAWSEFLCGPLSGRDELFAKQLLSNMEPLTGRDAQLAADLFNKTGRRSRSLADCMIAAVAIRCGAKLATINAPDFQPFVSHGLTMAQ